MIYAFSRLSLLLLGALAVSLLPDLALAAEGAPKELLLKEKNLPIYWGIPFVGMLLSIALFPLAAPNFWHHNFGKIAGFLGRLFPHPRLCDDWLGTEHLYGAGGADA